MMLKIIGFIFLGIILVLIIKGTSYNYGKCHSEMVKRGIAYGRTCGGLVGGTKNTGYLQEMCINCPFCHYTRDSFK
ncbi:hypothetical protein KTQ83_00805 [Holdemanella porci]|uniref:hypothetical protein n=1 Tax=Holdemanella porci TaxID=2652276 RepID=UPI001C26D0BD|nr:hypothetical protein [Holdemanella porci]MBU9130879.1 hypothetical protein [Holdemanella porci]MBU9871110.1 hypothetical protein [Holdemanella porci]MBU9886093.1 hypothetical protein [Holdemanella porci]